ncbi:related to pheromone response factor Prf1 [Ustilago trichophora]|uniref:Related to pheromone response factor Prf1 n=1 Tax=Ustilago trichophora TaxID=86804 RepID=A0A5C3E502_9BASI|nr:related to pheromone response factor Prf1 [Ustilago trichophora]
MSNHTDTTNAAVGSERRGHVAVDLFQGWSTDAQPSSSSKVAQGSLQQDPVAFKRSPSQDGAISAIEVAAPLFQSISFPKKETILAASLYTGLKDEDAQELDKIKRIPPSKRPGVSHAKKTPPNHIKRPRNAYIIFRSHTVAQKLIPKEVEHDHRNISRIIAHMWKSLAPEERAHYEQIAKEEKEKHKQLFPNYRYQPTTRRTGVNKRNVKKLENGEEECQEIADIILKAQGKHGVILRSGPSKAIKRAREATRQTNSTTAPPRKRAKVNKSNQSSRIELPPAEQMLETVFLHPSPSNSPTSGASTGPGAVQIPSPEPFRLASRTPSIDQGQPEALAEPRPVTPNLLGRRASSVPLSRPCSPPPPFVLANAQPLQETHVSNVGFDREDGGETSHTQTGFSDQLVMPAPAWKGRKAQPPPIPNTWQLCSYDDQSLPSPRSFDGLGQSSKNAMGRPRTAFPSTPSSGTFRGFFHPWAYEQGNESMLVSPMTACFQDVRRRSSLVRSGLVAARRPGSFGMDAHGQATGRTAETAEGSHSLLSAADPRLSDIELFDQAARAAAMSLESEAQTSDTANSNDFAFDPALEGEGCEPAPSSSLPVQMSLAGLNSVQSPTASPRPSFSGSTLAAAARDWASIKRRRSKMEQQQHQYHHQHQRSVIEPVNDMNTLPIDLSATCGQGRIEAEPLTLYRASLEESVERAVMSALGKDTGCGADRGERNSKIVQQILTSLSAELALQQQQQQQQQPSSTYGSELEAPRHTASKASSPIIEHSRRASQRSHCGSASPLKPSHQYFTGTAMTKPLPSPLQLVMSNHELSSDLSHASSQHCN